MPLPLLPKALTLRNLHASNFGFDPQAVMIPLCAWSELTNTVEASHPQACCCMLNARCRLETQLEVAAAVQVVGHARG